MGRPWKRRFLGYRTTTNHKPRLKPDPQSVIRGWGHYYRLANVEEVFEELDQWVRRRLRLLLWRQWKRPRTRAKKLRKRGLDEDQAGRSASNGRGPWWNAGSSHMNQAVQISTLHQMGLVSVLQQHRRLAYSS